VNTATFAERTCIPDGSAMMKSWCVPVLVLSAMLTGVVSAFAQQPSDGLSAVAALEQAITQVIEQAEPSVVSVARIRQDSSRPIGLRERGERVVGQQSPTDLLPNQFGTGVIVSPPQGDKRFVLTAYHIVRGGPIANRTGSGDGSVIQVWLPSDQTCSATIYAADPRSDLAVLKLDDRELRLKPGQLRPMSWSTAAPVHKGQFVITLGNPYWIARDGAASVSWGMVSNLVRRPAALTYTPGGPPSLIGIGAAIHVEQRLSIGSSGSPVINLRGEIVGIASSLAAIEGYERSGGFAIPIDASTRWIIETLLAGREVEYGFLGISPGRVTLKDVDADRTGQRTAALVHNVPAGSPAQIAGLRQDDFILAIDGQPTRSDVDLMRQVTLHPPDTVVQVLVLRNGNDLTVKVKLGKWPVFDTDDMVATELRYAPWRGLMVDYPTVRQRAEPTEIPLAVVITEVLPDSPAQATGLQRWEFITHVNRTPVKTPAEFAEAVKSLKGDVTLRLHATSQRPDRFSDEPGRTVVVKEKAASGSP
jgi:serine protease Do